MREKKVVVTKEQVCAVNFLKSRYSKEDIINQHALNNDGWTFTESKAINGMSVSDLAHLLLTSEYEVKANIVDKLKKNDYIKYKKDNGYSYGVYDRRETRYGICNVYAYWNGNAVSTWVNADKIELSSKEEYYEAMREVLKAEAFGKVKRELNQVRVGDIILVNDYVNLIGCGSSKALHIYEESLLEDAKEIMNNDWFDKVYTDKGVINKSDWTL